MRETGNSNYEGMEHDVLRLKTPEEARRFKIENSKSLTKWSPEALAKRFPRDERHGGILIADNGEMRRIFRFFKEIDSKGNAAGAEYAHEISRIAYDPVIAKELSFPFAIIWRDESRYDTEGYLTYYATVALNTFQGLPLGKRASYMQNYEYHVLPNGKKELARVIEQDVTKTIDLQPGQPIGNPYIIDFTNVSIE